MPRAGFMRNGLSLSYLDSAPDDAMRPVVLLLHGFPDQAAMWLPLMEMLHAQGYRAIAPDLRGYGESAMPPRVADMHMLRLIEDAAALLDHLGIAKVQVVGHDWGAVLAWMFAAHYAERTLTLTAISVGHPTAYARAGLDQKLAGWYTLFFQLRGICERILLGNSRISVGSLLRTHPQVDEVMRRMREPNRLSAALAIYRANLASVLFTRQPDVHAPTLGIWSRGDKYLVESQMRDSASYVKAAWRCEVLDGGHWIPLEQPQRLAALLLDHFRV